jgi:hypothetical protein
MTKMKKKLFVLLVVIMVLSVMSIPALARPSLRKTDRVEGIWTYLPAGPDVEYVIGPHTFLRISEAGEWTGTITGHADEWGEVVIHSSGPWYYEGTVPFESATVSGMTGGLVISTFGWRPDVGAEWVGTWEIISGRGGLASLRGGGTWEGPGWLGDPAVPGVLTYSGNITYYE